MPRQKRRYASRTGREHKAQLVTNLLGQDLTILDPNGSNQVSVFPKGGLARVEDHDQLVQVLIGAHTVLRKREVQGLGPQKEGVVYIVTEEVAKACPNRGDLLYPEDLKSTPTGFKATRFIKLAKI